MRQTSEWGMRALQSSCPRLKASIICEETGERRAIMKMMVLLFNLRSRQMGINQGFNTYMPAVERNANEELVAPLQRADHNYEWGLERMLKKVYMKSYPLLLCSTTIITLFIYCAACLLCISLIDSLLNQGGESGNSIRGNCHHHGHGHDHLIHSQFIFSTLSQIFLPYP